MTTTLSDQVNALIAENRRLRMKSEADDKTIHVLKEQYDSLQSGVENMVEDHRRIENAMLEDHRSTVRELVAERDRAVRAYTEIEGNLNQAADLIMQAARARVGNETPDPMPQAHTPHLADSRIPQVLLS